MSQRRALRGVALGVSLVCGVLLCLRPVFGAKRAPRPEPAISSVLPERSLYRLGASFQTDAPATFRLPELRGKFQVLALVFTRCPSVCPTLVHDLQALERAMPADARDATRFTLVSIDPAHDTPEALRAYRQKLGLGPERWRLLRGDADAVRDLSALLGFSYSSSNAGGMPLAHSKLVTVLDRNGVIIQQQDSVAADSQKIIDVILRAL